ncbi:hypothetical protein [Streptomyces sp. KMM 9044]|uniref:hypothetical protein n=1 Tax=Streptomyces sp. KMM 9044 TaxID=2744474 RepID=UPI0021515CCD|nr:hypothetical protein [Streptomyces sp. KMM 9044]WAX78906.1 hypothetical protein HUV60_015630 [Streptomyces sp. KMM 9044]
MNAQLVLLALCTGLGLGFLLAAVRAAATAAALWARGRRVMGWVTPRKAADRRRGGLVMFSDHLGRDLVLDPGRCGPFYGVPPVGDNVPVVYVRERPTQARLWTSRHLLAPSFGWFLSAPLAFGAGAVMAG